MTKDELLAVIPKARPHLDVFAEPLNKTMERFSINTPLRRAAFFAQIAHESNYLARMRENLNYTPDALMATFNNKRVTRFTKADANRYGRTADHPANQQMIANIAYADRVGNGAVESGDGWRYRGGGPGQLTFKDNYKRCGTYLGIDLVAHPELIEHPEVGCLAFGWFWVEGNPAGRDLNILADAGDIAGISRAVNGGDNGLYDRVALFEHIKEVLT